MVFKYKETDVLKINRRKIKYHTNQKKKDGVVIFISDKIKKQFLRQRNIAYNNKKNSTKTNLEDLYY